MQIAEVMTRSVDLADPNMKLRSAAHKMQKDDIGALPVGENDRLIGMVTDRDIVMRGVTGARSTTDMAVRDVMSEKICYCFADQSLEEAADLMAKHQVHRLPVLNLGWPQATRRPAGHAFPRAPVGLTKGGKRP